MKPIVAIALFLSGLGIAAVPASAQPKLQKTAQPVIVTEVKSDRFVDTVEALGTLRANETVTLTATVTETVTAVNFEDGQRVEAGDILVEMTNAEEAADLDAEQSTVEEARKQVERVESLVKSGATSQSLLDQRRREYETSKARLNAVQSRISDRLIVAPFAGVLGLRNISPGAVLQPGMRITTLDDDSVMKLDFSVPEVFMPTITPGLEIVATAVPFGDREFKGQVSSVDSQIDPVTRSLMVRALLQNEDGLLKPGLLMSVELLKNPRHAIVIPEEAVVAESRKTFAFRVDDDGKGGKIVRKAEIALGTRRVGEVEVTGGLKEGDVVVTHGVLNVTDGAPVTVRAVERGGETLQELLQQGANTTGKEVN